MCGMPLNKFYSRTLKCFRVCYVYKTQIEYVVVVAHPNKEPTVENKITFSVSWEVEIWYK